METYFALKPTYSKGHGSTGTIFFSLEMNNGDSKLLGDSADVAGGRGLWAQVGGHIHIRRAAVI